MISWKEIVENAPAETQEEARKAMLEGADAKQIVEIFARDGYNLSEEDVAKVYGGVLAKVAVEDGKDLSDEELEGVAGGKVHHHWYADSNDCSE